MRFDDQVDRVLLAQIILGGQEALKHLYTQYRDPLYRYLWHQLRRNTSWTEEVLQDVFLSIWRSTGGYRGEARVATWIFRIAHHLAANSLRDHLRRAEGHLIELGDTDEQDEQALIEQQIFSVDSHEDMVLDRLILTEALQRLAPKHRTVLELVFQQGFTLAEVAQVLAVPPGTVKSRITYARRALLSGLQQIGALEETACDK